MENKVISCLRPRRVRNKYTGEVFTVGCGTCPACLTRLANKASYMCSLQEADYKYCMFVTLTYSDDFIPLMRLESEFSHSDDDSLVTDGASDFQTYDCVDVTPRFDKKIFGEVVAKCNCTPFYISQVQRKVKVRALGDIPYLSRYDAQCFMKRFRKHLKKYSNEKISYYLVGEYGPVHFRPHFHILFYFNSQQTLENFRQVLFKSWSFGRVDYSLSRGKANSYVAKYVNCAHSIPRIYSDRSIRPFCLHSQNFALGFYKSQKKEIYENVPESFVSFSRVIAGKVSPTFPWRSLISCFFPKCRGYNEMSISERVATYRILSSLSYEYKTDSIADIVNCILNDLFYHFNFGKRVSKSVLLIHSLLNLDAYCNFHHISVDEFKYDIELDWLPKFKSSISSILYLSKHFLSFCCDGKSDLSSVDYMVNLIDKFYTHRDYENLCRQYSIQEDIITSSDDSLSALYYLYDNVLISSDDDLNYYFVISNFEVYLFRYLNQFDWYSAFKENVVNQYNKCQKHKYLNDLNNIFC